MNGKLKANFWIILSAGLIAWVLILQVMTLDRRALWSEEFYGLSTAAGLITPQDIDIRSQNFNGKTVTANDVVNLLRIDPKVPFNQVIQFLLNYDRQHFPLYYVTLKAFGNIFGDATWTLRFLSLICYFLCFPALWWLTQGMGLRLRTRVFALLAFALSPPLMFYGQTIREYGFWVLMTLLTHAAFFHAARRPKNGNWALYGLILAFNLYTSIFSLLLVPTHFVILFLRERKLNRGYFIATGIALLIAAPYFWFVFTQFKKIRGDSPWAFPTDWSIGSYLLGAVRSIGALFWNLTFACGLLILAVLGRHLRLGLRGRNSFSLPLVVLFVLPMTAFLAHDLLRSGTLLYSTRHTLIALVPLCILMAVEADLLFEHLRKPILKWVIAVLLLIPSLHAIYKISHSLHNRWMASPAQAEAQESLAQKPIESVVSYETKSVQMWVGLARKLPSDLPWRVIANSDEALDLPPKRTLLFRLKKSFLKAHSEEIAAHFTVARSPSDDVWILDPK